MTRYFQHYRNELYRIISFAAGAKKVSKYPPAKPGALVCEPLKAAFTEPLAVPCTPKGVKLLLNQLQLIESTILFLLMTDVLSNQNTMWYLHSQRE